LIKISEEHQNEILGVDFCPIDDFRDKRTQLVATCSKDHLIKIYDAKNDYLDIKQIEDHKSAVIGVKFLLDDNDPDVQIVSADAKGTVSIRSMDEEIQLTEPIQRELTGNKIYSITTSESTVILGTEKKVQMAQVRNNNTLVLKKSATPATPTTREFIKMEADEVGLYCIACSKKKRDMSYIDIKAGTISQTFSCGEIITGVKYSPNYKYLITTTGTGCIFIWKVPPNIEREIMFKSNQKALRISETPKAKISSKSDGFAQYAMASLEKEDRKGWGKDTSKPPIDFSRDTLPEWARSTVGVAIDIEDDGQEPFAFREKKDTDTLSKLKATVSDGDEDDDSKTEDDVISTPDERDPSKEQSEYNQSDEEGDAFNFDASKVRKTSI
jgi:WD40 repeat protein